MFGSEILEVAIGLSLIYLLVSVLSSAIREIAEAWFKTRAAKLEEGIREMLGDIEGNALAQQVYQHPLVSSLFRGGYTPGKRGWGRSSLPSYIPSSTFSAALLDVVGRGGGHGVAAATLSPDNVLKGAAALRSLNAHVARAVETAATGAGGDAAALQANVEAWFDSVMDRVSGWYKRRTQVILFGLGLGLAIVLNVDTVHLIRHLMSNDVARAAVVAHAGSTAGDSTVLTAGYARTRAALDSLGLPIGWEKNGGRALPGELSLSGAGRLASMLLGWLLTAFAVTLGAPFWFDLLNKFMVIRSTVKPHEKSPEEGSEDGKGARGGSPKRFAMGGAGVGGGAAADGAGAAVEDGGAGETDGRALPEEERELEDASAAKEFREPLAFAATFAASTSERFSVARRREYVDSILNDRDRFDFLRPAQQSWSGGKWLHSFSEGGKTFRVSASWGDTQKGTLTIVTPTAPGVAFGGARATFCNFNVSYCFHEAYGGPCLQFMGGDEKSANEMVELLRKKWKVLTPAQAARIANEGGFVIAGRKASPHGHVVFLLEGSDESGKPGGINTFHVGGGLPRERTVADIWGNAEVLYVTPHETFAEWEARGGG